MPHWDASNARRAAELVDEDPLRALVFAVLALGDRVEDAGGLVAETIERASRG